MCPFSLGKICEEEGRRGSVGYAGDLGGFSLSLHCLLLLFWLISPAKSTSVVFKLILYRPYEVKEQNNFLDVFVNSDYVGLK